MYMYMHVDMHSTDEQVYRTVAITLSQDRTKIGCNVLGRLETSPDLCKHSWIYTTSLTRTLDLMTRRPSVIPSSYLHSQQNI